MARKGRGWFGERRRHREAALHGKRRWTGSGVRGPPAHPRSFKGGLIGSADEKRIADLTENLEDRIWDRMGEYGFRPDDYKNVKQFERAFNEWSGWEDAYDEIGGEAAHEFDLRPGPDDETISLVTDIIHNRIYTSIMNSMDEMIRFGPEGQKGGVWWSVGNFRTEQEAEARAEKLRTLGYSGEPMHAKVEPKADGGFYTVFRKRR